MTLLFKYTFKKFSLVSLTLTLLIISVLWLAQSLRYMDLIVNNSVSMGAYFSLVAYLIPDLFVVISPIAFALAALFCFHRLMITHELAALRSLGISNLRLSLPVLSLASGLFLILMFLNILIVPASFQKLKQQEHVMRSAFSGALLREGSFNTSKGFTLYVREHNDKDELHGIFIYQPSKDGVPSRTTFAKSGQVFKNGERLLILLKKGQRQDYNPVTRQYAHFSFEEFAYDLTDAISNSNSPRSERASEKSIRQLLHPDASTLENMRRRFKSEAHQRLLLPFLCLFDALFISGILLSGELGRRYNRKKIVGAAGGVFLIHLLTMGLLHGSVRFQSLIWLSYAFIMCGIGATFWYLSKDLLINWHKKRMAPKQRLVWENRT
jgi:lipopolysaccharide export system permease protein